MKYNKKTLPSGLRIITVPEQDAMATTVLVLVETGSKYETKEINGVSHFLEHMCFKGTDRRPRPVDIATELDSLGAQFNAFTSQEYTGYYAKVQPMHASRALDIVADLYLHPKVESAEIEKEKGVIIEEINMYEDMPHRKVGEILMELMYGDQPAAWNIAGDKPIIRKITRDDFLSYRAKHYVASATLVVVAGKFDEVATITEIEKHFAEIPGGEKGGKAAVDDSQKGVLTRVKEKQSDQTHIAFGLRSYSLKHPDAYTLEVLAGVLGGGMSSRLFLKVREELGAAYYVRANQDSYTDHGIFEISAGVDQAKLSLVMAAIVDEMKKLKTEKVGDAELRKVKDSLSGGLYLGLEKSDEIASFYGGQEILTRKIDTPEDVLANLENVTSEDILRVANDIFVNDKLSVALIGPFKDSSSFVKLLDLS